MEEMLARTAAEMAQEPNPDTVCQGTVLSRGQYLIDVEKWNYADGRQKPRGHMSARDIAHWTAAIDQR